ncbi:histidine phosphatase family protein [Mobiluncus mulieris]|uniref:histidine phosphatase family protein n=1 Tax=Mobiluncus mulieris TaxID=2052 RepID=UPI0021E27216|nr:histidine phosphatase family protein [Mobiluncus mulieris]MCV0002146.1 histidine phosphatase family protein [Mobiluncus mulieris]
MENTAKTLLLWRHGQTDYNAALRIQGQIDIPLNATGVAQAEAAAAQLATEPIVRIVSSPLGRAVATAQCAAKLLGLPVETDARLQERGFGQWEGLTGEEIKAGWPDDFTSWRDWGDPDSARTGVESRRAVGERLSQACRDFAADLSAGQTMLVVSHGSACTQAVTTLLGLDCRDWFGFHGMDNCHWARLETTSRHPGWRVRGYNLGASDTRLRP